MRYKGIQSLLLLGLALLCSFPGIAQDSIPQSNPPDSVRVDTYVIRSPQEKVRSVPRGANLVNPVISFNQTAPLSEPYKRFRIPSFWEKENLLGLNLSEVAFVNWNAGGDNAITAIGKIKFVRNYKFRYISWKNDLEMRFGWNAQEGRQWRKTDDAIRVSSTFGYRQDTISNWYYSAKANFNTQFADGFKYPDRTMPISRFMAPGYLFLGAGASYISEGDKFNLYLSPITHRSTFVLDQELANNGAFGVEGAIRDIDGNIIQKGENLLTSLGFLVTNTWKTPLMKNIEVDHRISLYTDYLRDFGNIDLDWELAFNLTVNDFVNATIGTQLIYDDDIRFDVVEDEDGNIIDPGIPKVQLKQLLNIGVAYTF
jgi:hypothetical protein